ncbi:hypothetical protein [Spirosoma spitsbergense]|uniref:hypothetical protein n=1 Tax=Spirosoma spitsbergense TaxID=431554 RepID=UPI00036A3305|nr:hypothetical protein [Spirosoma spitsbergense]
MIKKHILLLLFVPFSLVSALRPYQTNPLAGTWRSQDAGRTTLITIADGYLMQTTYEPSRFIATKGGPYKQETGQLRITAEFDTADSSRVGQSDAYRFTLRNDLLTLTTPSGNQIFSRIIESSTALTGLWRITARTGQGGQRTPMPKGARKTIKLLTGSRFQWVALNPETKQFFGTGGGTYTLAGTDYTESIDFF